MAALRAPPLISAIHSKLLDSLRRRILRSRELIKGRGRVPSFAIGSGRWHWHRLRQQPHHPTGTIRSIFIHIITIATILSAASQYYPTSSEEKRWGKAYDRRPE